MLAPPRKVITSPWEPSLHDEIWIFVYDHFTSDREYRESGKTSNLRHCCGRKKIMQEQDQRRLTIIIKRDRRATLPQIAADVNVRPFNETSFIWSFRVKDPYVYPC
ncbi:uncharacterized protein TNCV_2565821 [Trichonephila clavipes]|nr:uncharacterized protein TNCV_2565821 [Trichonephila clavipes]